MNENAISEDGDINDLQERFKARREEIYRRIELGIPPEPMQLVTPKGVHKSDKLKAFVEEARNAEAQPNQPIMQIDRPPGTGKISGLLEESRRQFSELDKNKEK